MGFQRKNDTSGLNSQKLRINKEIGDQSECDNMEIKRGEIQKNIWI